MRTFTETAVGATSEVGRLDVVQRPDLAHELFSPTNRHGLLRWPR
jgi:hypothetical protein